MALRTPPALVGGGGAGGEVDGGLEAQGSLSGSGEKPPTRRESGIGGIIMESLVGILFF